MRVARGATRKRRVRAQTMAKALAREQEINTCEWALRDGLSIGEIAAKLGISRVDVEDNLNDALERLRKENTWLAQYDLDMREARINRCISVAMRLIEDKKTCVIFGALREVREQELVRQTLRMGAKQIEKLERELRAPAVGGDEKAENEGKPRAPTINLVPLGHARHGHRPGDDPGESGDG